MARWEVSDSIPTKPKSRAPVAGSKGRVFVLRTSSRPPESVFVLCDKGASLGDAHNIIPRGYSLATGRFCVDEKGSFTIEIEKNLITGWPSISEERFEREQLEKDKILFKVKR